MSLEFNFCQACMGKKWYSVLICLSAITSEVERSFVYLICLLCFLMSKLSGHIIDSFFFLWVVYFFLLSHKNSLYMGRLIVFFLHFVVDFLPFFIYSKYKSFDIYVVYKYFLSLYRFSLIFL